jgi:hypothetical protein
VPKREENVIVFPYFFIAIHMSRADSARNFVERRMSVDVEEGAVTE